MGRRSFQNMEKHRGRPIWDAKVAKQIGKPRRRPIWEAKVRNKLKNKRWRPTWDAKAYKEFGKTPPEANMGRQSCKKNSKPKTAG